MAITNKSQLANGTATQQNLYNQALARQAQLNNQQKYLQMAQVSPYFALGNMIGNMLADRYNSRGVNKEKEAISSALANYSGGQNYTAMNDLLNSPTIQATAQSYATPGVTVPGEGQPLEIGNNLGTSIQPQVTENSVTVPSSNSYGPALSTFDADKFKAQYYEDARKRGRTDDQINEAWSAMQPQITELANKAKEARIDTAFSAMKPDENGQYTFGEISMSNPQYIGYLRKVMKDSPELATLLVKGATAKDAERVATTKQNALFAQQDKTQARQQAFTLQLHDLDNAVKLAVANGKVNKNGVVNDVKTAIAVGKAYDTLEKKYTIADPNDPMRTIVLPRNQWSKLDQQRAVQYETLMGGGTPKVNTTQKTNVNVQYEKLPNPNDYNLTLKEIDKAIAKLSQDPNKSKGDIINAIRGQYAKAFKGQTGYVDQILQEMSDDAWKAYGVRGI